MAYTSIKPCVRCQINFTANSNAQKYCVACKALVRKENNVLWQHQDYVKNRTKKLEQTTAYNKSEKGRAAEKFRAAIRYGKMERQPCEICGQSKAQGHHTDYSKPLEVRWLCAKHHREEHLFQPWQNELRRAGYRGGFLLGELIEACGEGIHIIGDEKLTRMKWVAYTKNINRHSSNPNIICYGSTPEEAISMLYLSLHAKN